MSNPHKRYPTATEMSKLARQAAQNDLVSVSAAGALPACGVVKIAGGTGFALTMVAPEPGDHLRVTLVSITSGAVTLTAPTGFTFDGTNNTITMDAAADAVELIYKDANEYHIVESTSIALSSV